MSLEIIFLDSVVCLLSIAEPLCLILYFVFHYPLFFRVLVTFFFGMAGIDGVFDFAEIVQEMVTVGLPWPVLFAAGTIFCQLAGSALIVFVPCRLRLDWIGMLIVFTLRTILLDTPLGLSAILCARGSDIALEHITVVGGLIMSALFAGYRR